jgi:hypothetical protein
VVQYGESDAAFVRRLCEEEGLYFRFEEGDDGELVVLEDTSAAAPPAPFLRADGEPVHVTYCPWLGARLSMGERVVAMARAALVDALRPLRDRSTGEAPPLLICSDRHRPGLAPDDDARMEQSLAHAAGARETRRFHGAAGFFAALSAAEGLLAEGAVAVAVVAVDSHVGQEALAELVENPPSPSGTAPAAPAEGAAALVVTTPVHAHRLGLASLGTVCFSGTAESLSNDDNDVTVDGSAMTDLLRRLPPPHAPAALVVGQFCVDDLRHAEWRLAVARNPERVHPEYEMRSLDAELGTVGAATAAMNLAYGLAVVAHRTTDAPVPDGDPFLVWAISRDGTRGLAAVSVTL